MAPYTGSATTEQIEALLNFLDEHKDLARGRLRSVEGKVQAKRLWVELSNMLNAMGGCSKTAQQWQKVWFDRKHLAKKAAADSQRSATATGGGPSTAPLLSQWELKVLSIMGDGFGERQTGAKVPAFIETIEPIPSCSGISQGRARVPVFKETNEHNYTQPPSLDLFDKFEESVLESQDDNRKPTSASTQPISQGPLTGSSQTRRPRPRRRVVAGTNISSALFQIEERRLALEENRNAELAGIKAALQEIAELLKQNLNK